MFTSAAEHYERNLRDAENFTAGRARIGAPDGSYEPGVIIWSGKAIRSVMPIPEALRLANEIADAVAAHRISARSSLK